jgi:hypothetical protein
MTVRTYPMKQAGTRRNESRSSLRSPRQTLPGNGSATSDAVPARAAPARSLTRRPGRALVMRT